MWLHACYNKKGDSVNPVTSLSSWLEHFLFETKIIEMKILKNNESHFEYMCHANFKVTFIFCQNEINYFDNYFLLFRHYTL